MKAEDVEALARVAGGLMKVGALAFEVESARKMRDERRQHVSRMGRHFDETGERASEEEVAALVESRRHLSNARRKLRAAIRAMAEGLKP